MGVAVVIVGGSWTACNGGLTKSRGRDARRNLGGLRFNESITLCNFYKTDQAMQNWINQIHHGDCLTLLAQMPDATADLVVTSPPYNLLNSSGNGMKNGNGGKWSRAALMQGYATHSDAMPHDVYVDWQRECLHEMMRVLTPEGAIFYNHKWRVQKGLLQDRTDIIDGFPVRQIIIWQRSGGFNHNPGYFLPTYEVVYLIAKPNFRLAPKAGGVGDVWRIRQDRGNPHPASFPVELARRAIAATTAQVILDPFIGSGTTAVAALLEGRQFIGIDVSGDYCELARQRVDAVTSELANTPDPAEIPSALEVRAMLQSTAQPAEVPNPDP